MALGIGMLQATAFPSDEAGSDGSALGTVRVIYDNGYEGFISNTTAGIAAIVH